MAFLDETQERVIVRIVYDGPAMSGKTTNIRELYETFRERRGSEIVVPGQIGERTIFMDWLHVETGLVSGRHLTCHFISVPGQRLLERRRKILLGLADAVVFVCSAERRALDENFESFALLREKLAEREDEVPIVIQQNKLDHPEAISEAELREALDIGLSVRIVGARATEGVGVRETAGVAIRAAAERVRTIVDARGYGALNDLNANAHELTERMRQDERVESFDRASVTPDALLSGTNNFDEYRPPRPRAPVPGLPAPPGDNAPSGLIWPPDEGRAILRRALSSGPELESHGEARRLRYDAGAWSMWVDREARSPTLEEGRRALLRAVRKSMHLGSLRFPQMTLCLTPGAQETDASESPSGWFVWRISPGAASIKDTLDYAARSRSSDYLTEQLLGYLSGVAAAHELEQSLGVDLGLEISPDAFCLVGPRPYYLLEDRMLDRTTPLSQAILAPLSELVFPLEVLDRYAVAIRETFEAPVARPILEHLEAEAGGHP